MGNKEKNIAVVIVVVIVVVGIAWVLRSMPQPSGNSNPAATVQPTTASSSVPATVAPVPANVTVPNQGDASVPQGVAVPAVQAAAHPAGGSSSYRQFTLSAANNTFTPSVAIVKTGDIVDFEITAVDKDYDFTQPNYGFNAVLVKKGTTKKIQFEALSTGKFTFYCSACGGPSAGPVGYLIVANP